MTTTRQAQAATTRERLLDTAVHTIRAHGAAGLTLDAVAREAGVSKGGLLHHFPSKDALIEALLHKFFQEFDARVQAYYQHEPERAGRWLRAYIRATYEDEPLPMDVIMLLISALVENQALSRLINEDSALWTARLLSDGMPPARAMILRQAADAYWTEQIVSSGDAVPPAELRAELLRLTEAETW